MLIARRDNRIIRIRESAAERYAKDGYTVLDEQDNIIKEPEANTMGEARRIIQSLRAEVAGKDAEIFELKQKIAQLQEKESESNNAGTDNNEKKTSAGRRKKEKADVAAGE